MLVVLMLHALEPRPPPSRGPFFNGWCVRATEENAATSLIVGSFSAGDRTYAAHVAAIASTRGQEKRCVQAVVPEASLHTGSRPGPNFDWMARDVGSLSARPSRVSVDLRIDGIRARCEVQRGEGWNAEGWVRRVGWLVPCRYHVHALRAPCEIDVDGVPARGTAHVESNFGTAFPSEWVWVQAVDATHSLLAVGGRFKLLGPWGLPGYTWLVAYRTPEYTFDFRSTDLVPPFPKVHRQTMGTASLRLDLQRGRQRLELVVKAPTDSFFRDRLYVPTPTGFSNDPGSAETFDATVDARLFVDDVLVDVSSIRTAALEFGGSILLP